MVTLTLVNNSGLLMFNQSLQCDSPHIKWRWGRGPDNVKQSLSICFQQPDSVSCTIYNRWYCPQILNRITVVVCVL